MRNQPVAEGETGEIQVRGYALAACKMKSTATTSDGFYRTGDMATVRANAFCLSAATAT